MTVAEQLQRQVFKDHLLRCHERLTFARASIAGKSGLEWASATLSAHLCQSQFVRALDMMWEEQGRENESPDVWEPEAYVDDLLARHYRP